MKMKSTAVVLLALYLMLGGCAAEPKDLTGQTLEAVPPEEVALYQRAPGDYDVVGMVTLELTPDLTWNERGEAPKAINQLKTKAGAMGANGLLFNLDKADYDVQVTAGYQHKFYQIPIRLQPKRCIVARAILVRKDDVIPRAVDARDKSGNWPAGVLQTTSGGAAAANRLAHS